MFLLYFKVKTLRLNQDMLFERYITLSCVHMLIMKETQRDVDSFFSFFFKFVRSAISIRATQSSELMEKKLRKRNVCNNVLTVNLVPAPEKKMISIIGDVKI